MNCKKRTAARRILACALAAAALLPTFCSCKKKKTAPPLLSVLKIGLTGEPLSSDFISDSSSLRPTNASNEEELAVSMMVASPIMRRDGDTGWFPVLGQIAVEEKDGVSVATVTLKSDVKYNNGNTLNIDSYINLIKALCEPGSRAQGVYADFYRNPIKGLAAYRYGYLDISSGDIPDFEEEARAYVDGATREQYREALEESRLFGSYLGNPAGVSYNGKDTFAELILRYSRNEETKKADWFTKATSDEIIAEVAAIYSNLSRDEWLLDDFYAYEAGSGSETGRIEKDFAAEMQKRAKEERRTCAIVTGIEKISGSTRSCRVTFEKEMVHKDAIVMLNLPLFAMTSGRMIGTSGTVYEAHSDGADGGLVELSQENGKKKICFFHLDERDAYDTVYLGQADAVMLPHAPTSEEKSSAEKTYGLRFCTIGYASVVYNPETVSEERLRELQVFYRYS